MFEDIYNVEYYSIKVTNIRMLMDGKYMKTIMKYELIINEALRSALEFDMPDDEINEFIRFFGKHIGSDRIYIFEDKLSKGITKNTYEWCRNGIDPQIDQLQAVDMDIIDWWYESFDKGESIIVTDIEDIKETHRASYDILKGQNIHNVAVSPLRYKDEIRGFFGVDNPPEDDYKGLSVFLDMIGTLLISLLKLRNSFVRSNEQAKISSYSALAQIYLSMHLVNVKKGSYKVIKTADYVEEFVDGLREKNFEKRMFRIMNGLCEEKYKNSVLDFIKLDTLQARMEGKDTIAHEFVGNVSGWCRERFIKVDEDANGNLCHVLYCVEVIDEEKRRENKLLYLSETDLMTGICNRGSGEHKITKLLEKNIGGLLCLIDCDKFKLVNDTYGHAVGDKVIIAVADALQKSCRENDIVMRLGGDEFALYIPGLFEKKQADTFVKRVFSKLEEINIPEMDNKKIYISLGASFCYDGEETSFDRLYKEADTAMYTSKKTEGYCATIYQYDKI